MQMDGLYVQFDSRWQASESLERLLGEIENDAARLFDRLDDPSLAITSDDANQLAHFIALQACRHPDVMGRGHRAGKELAEFLADVHSYSDVTEFVNASSRFVAPPIEMARYYNQLVQSTPEALLGELDSVLSLSPQDPRLPATDVLKALPKIRQLIGSLQWSLLHAPQGKDFILGDTPLPQSELGKGFRIPLSRSTAVSVTPGAGQSPMSRSTATAAEVDAINREQWDNALSIAIGPSRALLQAL